MNPSEYEEGKITELAPRKKLTYEELVKILCILAVRLERLEDLILGFYDGANENELFRTQEILKTKVELIRHENKDVPYKRFVSKRITDLENSFKGFLSYYHENLDIDKLTKKEGVNAPDPF